MQGFPIFDALAATPRAEQLMLRHALDAFAAGMTLQILATAPSVAMPKQRIAKSSSIRCSVSRFWPLIGTVDEAQFGACPWPGFARRPWRCNSTSGARVRHWPAAIRGARTVVGEAALDRHQDAAVTSLIPALSCRSCRPNAPFAELVRLSRTSIADEMRIEHTRRVLGD
jgi:hypothetical protein